jgi:hypothetical protein
MVSLWVPIPIEASVPMPIGGMPIEDPVPLPKEARMWARGMRIGAGLVTIASITHITYPDATRGEGLAAPGPLVSEAPLLVSSNAEVGGGGGGMGGGEECRRL